MSNADKRSVSTDALETLGMIITPNEGRDAIHLAVEPVEAGEDLEPGANVGIVDGKGHSWGGIDSESDFVGIVDPFLEQVVKKGQWFWLVVYPRQITSLRHVWTHPAFEDRADPAPAKPDKETSKAYLLLFSQVMDCPDFETLIEQAGRHVVDPEWDGYTLVIDGQTASGNIPAIFWDHFENYTGVPVPQEVRAKHFSCSC